jgi:hypothetical protein
MESKGGVPSSSRTTDAFIGASRHRLDAIRGPSCDQVFSVSDERQRAFGWIAAEG